MINRFDGLPPEEKRVLMASGLGAVAALWLAVAWAEPMLLLALPLLGLGCFALIRLGRRRAGGEPSEAQE